MWRRKYHAGWGILGLRSFQGHQGSVLDAAFDGLSMFHSVDPAPGEAMWMLVRGSNCVGDSSYDSSGTGQSAPRDPAIAAAAAACP